MPVQCCQINLSIGTNGHIGEETIMAAVLREDTGLGIIEEHTLPVCTNPNEAILRARHLFHSGADDNAIARSDLKTTEGIILTVVDIKTEGTAEPDVVVLFQQRRDGVVIEGRFRGDHVAIYCIVLTVKAVEAVGGTQPHKAIAVTQGAQHTVVRESIYGHVVLKAQRGR